MAIETIKVDKIFRGHVSVRDYRVQHCVDHGLDLRIEHDDEYMVVSHKQLKQGLFQFHKRSFKSRFKKGQKYELIDFKWVPYCKEQERLF